MRYKLMLVVLVGLLYVTGVVLSEYGKVAMAEWQEMDKVYKCAREQVAMGIERKDVRCSKGERNGTK